MSYLITVDGGVSSGFVLGHYSVTDPWTRVGFWQIPNGVQGVLDWYNLHFAEPDYFDPRDGSSDIPIKDIYVLAEKFIPLSGNGFSHTLGSVEPLRVEGALIALGLLPAEYPAPQWQRADQQYFCGGDNVREKRKRSKAWLKEKGLSVTGKSVGAKDAEDVISATLHALSWARKNHEPSKRFYWPDTSKAPA